MPDLVDYDEFAYFHENAAEYGLPYDGSPTVHRVRTELADGRIIRTGSRAKKSAAGMVALDLEPFQQAVGDWHP